MHRSLITVFDFFLPRFCAGCNKKLKADEKSVCTECLKSILTANENILKSEYERKFSSSEIIKDFYSRYIFETDKALQAIIHALKYESKFGLGIFLGEKISEGLKLLNWNIDLILPVPIHHLKKAERGYNQSDFIVKGLSKSLEIPFSTKVMRRTRFTESQTGLNIKERAANVEDAFTLRKKRKIAGKNILLVDDVITTGATILECGKVLIDSGAKAVYACSIAIAE